MKPFDVLVENGGDAERDRRQAAARSPGVAGAAAPRDWRRGADSLVEAFPADRRRRARASRGSSTASTDALKGTDGTLGGVAAVDRDFVHAIYGNFPYVLAFVLLLTLILLARAFRSIVLPIKAVLLNLLSLGGGVRDHRLHLPGGPRLVALEHHGDAGDHRLDPADDLRVPVRPLDGLRGLHALAHARGLRRDRLDRPQAIELGLARTGKLVTSAALILMFAFLVLSSSPGFEIKEFAIGLAAGIIFDATVIRALLVPVADAAARRRELVDADWTRTALFIREKESAGEPA